MQVSRWGNSLAIRLPAALVKALALKEGDEVTIHIAAPRALEVSPKASQEESLRRLCTFRGRMPANFKFDRDDAHAR